MIPVASSEEAEFFFVYPGEDALRYNGYGSTSEEMKVPNHPSIYHWLLYEVRLAELELADEE